MLNPIKDISTKTRYALGIGSVLTLLAIWALVAGLGWVSPAKLPTPWAVAGAFVRITEQGQLFPAIFASVSRIALAAVLMVIVGLPVGILMGSSKAINAVLSPIVDPFRSAPIVALIPVLVMWFGIGELMKISFLWIGAVVYLIPMVRDAVQAVDPKWYIYPRDLGASKLEAMATSVVPMAAPRIADSVIVSISVMWTYITVAELVNSNSGLGKMIEMYRKVSQMDAVFAGIITIIVLALVTYQGMVALRNWKYKWETR